MVFRAYLDTNLYLSFLLNPDSSAPPATIVRPGVQGKLAILVGDPTIDEIQQKATNKPYLAERIPQTPVDVLLLAMEASGSHIRTAPTVIPAIGRDRKDDYLLTYSVAGNATHLITGSSDLLMLEHDFGFQIVSPAEFMKILNHSSTT